MRLIEIPSRRSLGGFDMRYLLMLGIAIGATGEPTVEVGQAPNPKEAMLEATETPFGTNRRRLCDSCSGDDAHCDCNCACVARVDRPGYVYVPDYIAQYGTYWYQTTDDATGYSDQSEAEAACTSDRNCAGVAERQKSSSKIRWSIRNGAEVPISSANLNGPATRWAYWRKLDGYQPGWQPGWQAGPDGTFFVHGDYKPFDGQPCNGRPFCDGYQPFDPGNQPFDPDVWYDGDVDCKQTCGAYEAEAVGARGVCNCFDCGGNTREACSYEMSGGPEMSPRCDEWVDRFEFHHEDSHQLGKDCANFASIVGTTPDTFPILTDDWDYHSIQCQCRLPASPPPPPWLPPPSPSTPPPPPIACDQLVDDEGACGQANGNICRHCCSRVTETCGTDDGSGPWCGADNLPKYSFAKLEPNGTRCREIQKVHSVTFQPPQCVVNPASGKTHCMRIPEGYNINDDNDPVVARMKQRTFSLHEA